MASFGRQFSGSPVLTMSPQHSLQTPRPMANFPRRHVSPRPFGSFTAPPRSTTTSAGRKRSRDEASVNLEADVPPSLNDDQWVYGEGMVLIKAGSSYTLDATSQSGTWVDEKLSSHLDSLPKKTQDLDQRTHKSQRLGHSSSSVSPASTPTKEALIQFGSAESMDGSNGPVIDDFTLQLGIGWRKISNDEHIQAAARGWARYIENHYPITNARITLESRGLQSYLVEASEGFFLFDENLRQGRLVSQDSQRALRHLQCSPPTFDGTITLTAAESPRPADSGFSTGSVDTEMSIA